MARTLGALMVLLSLTEVTWAETPPDREVLFQVSTINALLKGLYDGTTTVGRLREHGDFGIGTFHALDGEMVMDQGVCYQIASDGACRVMSRSRRSPFAAVTFFETDRTLELSNVDGPGGFDAALLPALPSVNLFHAIRITGEFELVRARSVPRQARPYPLLTEVVKTQPTFEYRDVKGMLVGFRSPPFVEGLNVSGYHFHFIDAERKVGGHVLECRVRTGTAEIDVTPSVQVSLPDSPEFYGLDLSTHSAQDVQRVEK